MKVFIAGPRAIRTLSPTVQERLRNIIEQKFTVLVGDAGGIDKMIQEYFSDANYKDVLVYASNGAARNNVGQWKVQNVPVKDNVTGFAFYVEKDKAMADSADYGFMIWNGKSRGTLNNIINLTKQSKTVLVYLTPHKKFYNIKTLEVAQKLAAGCGEETRLLFDSLAGKQLPRPAELSEQISLFQAM
jgi:hypothetical protein